MNDNGEIVLVVGIVIGSILNYIYNAYLSRVLGLEEFGLISLFGNFIFIAGIYFGTLTATLCYQSAYSYGQHKKAVAAFWKKIRKNVLLVSIGIFVLWTVFTPHLQEYFNSPSAYPFLLFAPVWILGAIAAVDFGYLEGAHKFRTLSLFLVSEAIAKLVFTYLILTYFGTEYLLAAIPLSMIVSLSIGYLSIRKHNSKAEVLDESVKVSFPKSFFTTSIIYRFSIIAFISFDLILARRYLTPTEAGYYALISLVGKMIYILSSLSSQFLLPYISKSEGENGDSQRKFWNIFGLTAALGSCAFIIFGLLGSFTGPLLLGDKIAPVTYLLPIYSLAILLFTLSSTIIGFHQVKKNYMFSVVSILFVLVQMAALSYFGNTLEHFVYTFLILSMINLSISLIFHFFEKQIFTVWLNLKDSFGLFTLLPEAFTNEGGRKILVLNWRDTKHTWAGGAEVYVHEVSKCLVKDGNSVLLFCGNDQKSSRYEVIDGVHIIRRGGQYTVYIWAFLYYIFKFHGKFEVIIDSENGIPFFSPIYAGIPVIGLVHHIHRDIIIKELELAFYLKPLAYLARILESNVMPIVYRNSQMITVSNSTKKDMEKIGLGVKKEIKIVNPGIEIEKFKTGVKTQNPSILYLGRIKPYKSIETAIVAVSKLVNEFPDLIFNIAGFGDYQPTLEKFVKKLKLQNHVKFLGKVSEEEKVKLMAAAWAFVYPSVWEGWGISVIEANACGTPVIASKVPGLVDSVSNNSGFLIEQGNADAFAEKIKLLIEDKKLRTSLSKSSIEWSHNFTWKKSTQHLEHLIDENLINSPAILGVEYGNAK